MNSGGCARLLRNVVFDINDFDETSPEPWEWDVKRLVASIVLAAQGTVYPTAEAVIVLSAVRTREFSGMDPLRVWYEKMSAADFIESLPRAFQKSTKKRQAS